MSHQEIYHHFRADERHFVDRASEWVENAAKYHEVKLTDFLDPRQCFILESLVHREQDAKVSFFGGYDAAERKRAIVAPDYHEAKETDFQIQVLHVYSVDNKLETLQHSDYLGSVLGLGLKRDKIGDMHVRQEGCHVLIAEEIASYLAMNLIQVHRVGVVTDIEPLSRLQTVEPKLEPLDLTVASLRLDGISSDVFRLSRSKILIPIKAGRCKVNWRIEEDPSKVLAEGDIVALKGFGRFKVLEVEGITKKGRTRVKIGKFV
jgi:RNA-binding protein YlmH